MIEIENLAVKAGGFGLAGIDLSMREGEYGVLMGRTGCGKTTLLEALCGLREICEGTIRLLGRDVTRLPPADRGIGFVPQDGALFASRTVRGHLSFGPLARGWGREEVRARAEELAEQLGIGHLLERKPARLSGGERQRVALGRALAARPRILCLDEPLGALDEETHEEMVALIRGLVREEHVTTLHITHSRREAGMIADRVFSLRDGRIHEDVP